MPRVLLGLALFLSIGSLPLVSRTEAATTTPESATSTMDREVLETLIRARAEALEKVNRQLLETEEKLRTTREQGTSLQKELKTLDYTVNQLELNIQADDIASQKLTLEIDSLAYDIRDIELSMDDKKEAITHVLRELQKKNQSNLLVTLLRHDSLADGLLETQSLVNLRTQLAVEVETLDDLRTKIGGKLAEVSDKRSKVESHKRNLGARKALVNDQKEERRTLLTQTKNQEKTYQQQLSELEKLQSEVSAEVEKIEEELRRTINPDLLPLPRRGVLAWPVKDPVLTQGYGQTSFAVRNYPGKHHNGVDFRGRIGTEVFAAEDGRVINVGDQDRFCRKGAYGRFAVVKHTNGLATLYGHLSRYAVAIGQLVKRGDLIGYIGQTGWATGPHLHFTVFATQTLTPARPGFPEGTKASRVCGPMPVGGDLDPLQYLEVMR